MEFDITVMPNEIRQESPIVIASEGYQPYAGAYIDSYSVWYRSDFRYR